MEGGTLTSQFVCALIAAVIEFIYVVEAFFTGSLLSVGDAESVERCFVKLILKHLYFLTADVYLLGGYIEDREL